MNYHILESYDLAPHVPALKALEQDILYPIEDGARHFTIDHGTHYHDFFSRKGSARFLIAQQNNDLVGTMAGIWHQALWTNAPIESVYLGDLKLSPNYRGQKVVHRMVWHAFCAMWRQRRLRGWSLIYGAAMAGDAGDVTRSVQGAHLGHLLQPMAKMDLFFASPQTLSQLNVQSCPSNPNSPGLDLSPALGLGSGPAPLLMSNDHIKTMRIVGSDDTWRLRHLNRGPSTWTNNLGHTLQVAGAQMNHQGFEGDLCFALDRRLTAHHQWCIEQGIKPGAMCTIYGLPITQKLPETQPAWLHLCPADI